MATIDRVEVEDLDVFTIPHNRIKYILNKVSRQAKHTDYSNQLSFGALLRDISATFLELKQHEEIENKYIMKILKRKLRGESQRRLNVHLHAHSHISDILKQVKSVEQQFQDGPCTDMQLFGSNLNTSLQEFFDEYEPHMQEEEQVLQPLLMKFLPTNELRQIKQVVLQLHHLKNLEEKQLAIERSLITHFEEVNLNKTENFHNNNDEENTKSAKILPVELLTNIFSLLGPRDLCRCAQVCRRWNEIAFSGNLWKKLHLSRWGLGDWRFGKELSSDNCNCDCEPNYELMTFIAEDKLYSDSSGVSEPSDCELSCGEENVGEENVGHRFKRENKMLHGVCRYLLPRVGDSVTCIVLECSKALTNGLLFRILSQCKNVKYLDISQTIISDLGMMGLFKHGCQKLKHLDLSGCENITDKTLNKLSTSIGKINTPCSSCNCARSNGDDRLEVRRLRTLSLSGCYQITDTGLRSLSKHGGLPSLRRLDLSGCFNVTDSGIEELVSKCPKLDLTELFYCDNIFTGSYDGVAGGCQNNGCLHRMCCRTGLFP